MTCKFCGSTIDDNLVECPYCGHKTGVAAPADPAAEMTEQFAAQESQDKSDAKSAKTSSKRGKALGSIGSALSNGIDKAKSGASGNKAGAKSSAARNGNSPVSGNGLIAIGLIACLLLVAVDGVLKGLFDHFTDIKILFMSYEFDLLHYLVRTDHREAYPATFKIICTGISGISLIAYLISGLLNEDILQVNAISVVFDFLILFHSRIILAVIYSPDRLDDGKESLSDELSVFPVQ